MLVQGERNDLSRLSYLEIPGFIRPRCTPVLPCIEMVAESGLEPDSDGL
jgi:hypothetical protein